MPAVVDCLDLLFSDVAFPMDQCQVLRNFGGFIWYVCMCVATKGPRKTRSELAKLVDADYHGYRDEEDGILVPLEQQEEEKGLELLNV